jgi:alkyl hydroperoxide reductase subunit AhpC
MSTGRNFNEILRVLDSMQLTAAYQVSTPVNWNNGDDVIIPAALPEAEAREKYPAGLKIVNRYLRYVPQPGMN